MARTVREQALGYLRDGRVVIRAASWVSDGPRAGGVWAEVFGHADIYRVKHAADGWSCTCDRPAPCPHVAAVQLVTGHPSAARKAGVTRLIADLKTTASPVTPGEAETTHANP